MNEYRFKGLVLNGFLALLLLAVIVAAIVFIAALPTDAVWCPIVCALLLIVFLFSLFGFFQLEPNQARVMVFFGKYKGTFDRTGFYWVNPFYKRKKLSLRARNLDVSPIKVNDKSGNPIMVGMVLVWKLRDTYKAMFEIDSQTMAGAGQGIASVSSVMKAFENFVNIQSDAALRQVVTNYNYDNNEGPDDEINDILEKTLNERLEMAGIEVIEARINYLAYAPEIAAVMLRRQQASAVISAREKIVEGAVSMVKMALDKLESDKVVALDPERKAVMVSNLLVVLCADEAAQPVVNTGSLYN